MPRLVRSRSTTRETRPRNDPGQYDDLVQQWWNRSGPFALLHAIAQARATLIPAATGPRAVLVDLACGGGLLAPHLAGLGYRHVGVDITASALRQAAEHGVLTVRGDVLALPLPDAVAEVVVAGEILEHVTDLPGALAEACRVLKPGGRLVIDTLADTALARLLVVHIAERIPGGAPKGIHDPKLFVNRDELRRVAAAHGVPLTLRGLRPSVGELLRLLARRGDQAPLVATRPTAVLFQAFGTKEAR